MTIEQMSKAFEDIKWLEADLMRPLTDEEKNVVISEGVDYFVFNTLGYNMDEYDALLKARRLISSFCTEDEETYDRVVKEVINPKVKNIFRSILNDLEATQTSKEEICPEKELKHPEVVKYPEDTTTFSDDEKLEVTDHSDESVPVPSTEEFVEKLKAGETLTLDTKTINEIIDYIWENVNGSFSIKRNNNQLKASFF